MPERFPRSSGGWGGCLALLALVTFLLTLGNPAHAAAPHRRAVLVLLHGTTAETFLRAISDPKWERLRSESALGLMNATVPVPMTPESAYLTLGAGRRLRAPRSLPPTAIQMSAGLMELPVGSARVRIEQLGLAPGDASAVGGLGGACLQAGKNIAYLGSSPETDQFQSSGVLAAMTETGELPIVVNTRVNARHLEDVLTYVPVLSLELKTELLVVDLPPDTDNTQALQFAERLARALDPIRDLFILTSADPGPPSHGEWTSLAPVLIWNWGWHERAITSNTTRTRGLIANVDIAPTLLDHLGVPIPATMLGHPARPAGAGSVESALRYARGLRATHEAMKPGLIAWGVFAFLGFLAGVAALLTRSAGTLRRTGRFWLTWAAAFIPAMLLAGVAFCGSAAELVGRVVGISLVLAVAAAWSIRRRVSPVLLIYGLIVLTVLADLFTGSHLLQRSLLGDYAYTGARFYGIGNEFEGLILGTSILAPLWGVQVFRPSGVQAFRPSDSKSQAVSLTPVTASNQEATDYAAESPPRYRGDGGANASSIPPYSHTPTLLLIVALWLLTLYAVAAPARGADFGGAFSLAVGYAAATAGVWQLRTGKRLSLRQLLLAGVVVALVVAAMIGADLARPAGARSHVGELAARALSEGWRPVWEIAVRKVAMNVSFILSPYCLVSLAGVLPVVVIGYHKLDPASRSILTRRPLLRVGLIATLIGAVAGLLANDSGIVAWAFATGCALLLCLDLMLDDGARKAPEASGTALPTGGETA